MIHDLANNSGHVAPKQSAKAETDRETYSIYIYIQQKTTDENDLFIFLCITVLCFLFIVFVTMLCGPLLRIKITQDK